MKADISEAVMGGGSYRIVFEAENANEHLLLDILTDREDKVFTSQEDGVICVVNTRPVLNINGDAPAKRPYVRRAKRRGKRTRVLSASARASISAAQRKRWAKWHREQGAKRG